MTSITRLRNSLRRNKKNLRNQPYINPSTGLIEQKQIPKILLRYQARWNADESQIKVCEKSRRIGLSWADAADSALQAGRINGSDTFYIGYNKSMAQGYINDCADWARAYNLAASSVEETVIEDENDDIIAYKIRFATGFVIEALSSKPRSIRSKGKPNARLRIDELAFHDDPEEVLKAAIAFKIWGGKIAIWSTHNGVDNPFNKLVNQIKKEDFPYSLHKYTFMDAVADGLYKRICLITNKQWTPESELEWIAQTYKEYGINAAEELDCIPNDYESTKFIDRNWFRIVDRYDIPVCDRFVRFWDLAATQKDVNNKKKKPCNTAGVLIGYSSLVDQYVVLDCVAEAFNPANTNRLILNVASQDGYNIPIAHELEGGSSGIRDASYIKTMLSDYFVTAVKPQGDKLLRAKGFASSSKNGQVSVLRGDWNEEYLDELDKVPHGLFDRLDASSGAYNYLNDNDPIRDLMNYFND